MVLVESRLDMLKGNLFKNVLAIWLAAFGLCVMLQPQVGASERVFTTLGDVAIVQLLGLMMVIFAAVGLVMTYTPYRLFFMSLPYGLYMGLVLVSFVRSSIQDLALPILLTALFVLPFVQALDELRRR